MSRSFTYENNEADAMILAAQSRTVSRATEHGEKMTAQQGAAWNERALNAENEVRNLGRELAKLQPFNGNA